jgi:DNA polymerase-3 subunit gamma/tau
MSSAVDQGFKPAPTANSESSPEPLTNHNASTPIAEQEAQAQSAIARILRDRNISGAGRLSGKSTSTSANNVAVQPSQAPAKKPEQHPRMPKAQSVHQGSADTSSSELNSPSSTGSGDIPPWATDSEGESEKKHELPVTGGQTQAHNHSNIKPASKIDFKAKHQTITENLAPELLEQINPQKAPEIVPEEVSIPAPDDFQSPISEIRFAHQQDEWAYLIKRMGLGGRMRQFALHSIFTKQGNSLHIDVDESQKHLDTPMLRQRLDAALSSIYEHNVSLSINFAKGVIDSPYLIQQKIDAGRHQQAIDVITSDENIVQFQQVFSAEIDENSIQAL